MLLIYFPTIIVLLIIYLTNFLPSYYVDSLLLTSISLLFITSLFLYHSSSVPTAYLKMSDVWQFSIVGLVIGQTLLLVRMSNLGLEQEFHQCKLLEVTHAVHRGNSDDLSLVEAFGEADDDEPMKVSLWLRNFIRLCG